MDCRGGLFDDEFCNASVNFRDLRVLDLNGLLVVVVVEADVDLEG